MNLTIAHNIIKDLENYQFCLVDKAYPSYERQDISILPPFAAGLRSKLEVINSKAEKNEVIKSHLSAYRDNLLLELSAETLSKAWQNIAEGYMSKLLTYFQINDYEVLPVTCYLTTLEMCPYNRQKRYFYVPFYANLAEQIRIIMHELMHIVFLDNYQDYLKEQGISKQGILDICESLTVLLNSEFKEFMLVREVNDKPSTYDLQAIVEKEHEKQTSFQQLLRRLAEKRLNKVPKNS